jgi:hypothetical protein
MRSGLRAVAATGALAVRLPNGRTVPVPAVSTTGGRLAVSDDIRLGGWWRGGSRIGDPFGSTLIVTATPVRGPEVTVER